MIRYPTMFRLLQCITDSCLLSLQNGLTPLHLCAQEDKVNVASILAKNGVQIDAKTKVTIIRQSFSDCMQSRAVGNTCASRDRSDTNEYRVFAYGVSAPCIIKLSRVT